MADITAEQLRETISTFLKDADLNTLSSKKVRKRLEDHFGRDFTSRKKEIDRLVMDMITASHKDSQSDEEGSEDEDPDSASSEDEPSPKKKRKPAPVKKEKIEVPSEESDRELDDEALARKLQEEERNSRRRAASRKVPSGKRGARKKKDDDDKPKTKRGNSTYSRKIPLSEKLADIVGAKEMARHDVVKKMYEIVRERNLFDPNDRRYALCDEQLLKVFGGNKRVLLFGMLKHLKHHMVAE